jgi:RimJ/RimL family protein N-acetyltransferase
MGVMIGDKDYWGQGVVLEARARILDFIFAELPIDKVSGGCYQTNGPAIFNYQRQGWKVDGIRKAEHLDRGRRVDTILFAMFREDWLSRGDR